MADVRLGKAAVVVNAFLLRAAVLALLITLDLIQVEFGRLRLMLRPLGQGSFISAHLHTKGHIPHNSRVARRDRSSVVIRAVVKKLLLVGQVGF